MTNGTIPERGEVEWEVEGKTYVLALPLRQLRALDNKLSCGSTLRLMAPGSRGLFDAKTEDLSTILAFGLIGGGNPLKDDEIERLFDKFGLGEFINICDKLISAVLKGAPKPTKEERTDPLPSIAASEN